MKASVFLSYEHGKKYEHEGYLIKVKGITFFYTRELQTFIDNHIFSEIKYGTLLTGGLTKQDAKDKLVTLIEKYGGKDKFLLEVDKRAKSLKLKKLNKELLLKLKN